MLENALYLFLALFGLSFLIFIHELGHYFMARKVGMRVEVFSIGFGKPFLSWKVGEVKWQMCYLLFGGYVKVAGQDDDGKKDPYEVSDGFYGKKPMQRIWMLLMGPLVNIVFALILFTAIWMTGGREKPFSEFTNVIGDIDKNSELYQKGVRPGDQIFKYNDHKFEGFKDLLYASVLKHDELQISGDKVDYLKGTTKPYDYTLKPYQDPRFISKDFKTIGILSSAKYLIYDKLSSGEENPIFDGSPMQNSGIQYGDRIIWVNGELVFSMNQLSQVINEQAAFITVERDGERFFAKVPRLQIRDLKLSSIQRAELEDWIFELGIKAPINELTFIPYMISPSAVVESSLRFLGEDAREHHVVDLSGQYDYDSFLKPGDKIKAIDGIEISSGYKALEMLQKKHAQIIVQRAGSYDPISWKIENPAFIHSVSPENLSSIINSIKNGKNGAVSGSLHQLNIVAPMSFANYPLKGDQKSFFTREYEAREKQLQQIKNPEKRQEALSQFNAQKEKLILGISLQDRVVIYNPNPLVLFSNVIKDTARSMSSLFTGKLNPKWFSGPIGMVQAIHHGWMLGAKEALFWIATISLGLGVFNLLPLPALDGGHICFSLYEMITRRRLSAKVMERLIIPFVVVLIGLFVFVTYQDVIRLVGRFF